MMGLVSTLVVRYRITLIPALLFMVYTGYTLFASSRLPDNHPNKTRDFAVIIPGIKSTYRYTMEEAYYDGYAEAYFGITMKKSGWDCMRHY